MVLSVVTAAAPWGHQPAAPAYARAHRARFLSGLCDFIRLPSVSSQPERAAEVRRCARWLAGAMRDIGLDGVSIVPTGGHPLVTGGWLGAPGQPTVLLYGHYDVQPAEPLAAWQSPPFQPAVRGGSLYGRGASDDKGPLFAHLCAIRSYLDGGGWLPVNVLCLFDGEEEIGSPHLSQFLQGWHGLRRVNAVLVSDTRMLGPERPAITYALRGTLGLEVEVRGPPDDRHSGAFGGAIANPAQALSVILAGLHDRQGRIRVPGFYDRVRPVALAERAAMAAAGPADAELLRAAGVRGGWGEPGYSLYERTTIRPALTINGLTAGHQGPGGKGIIPARALAKLSVRLVPDQRPAEAERLLRRRIAALTPPGVRTEVRAGRAAVPVLLERRNTVMRAAATAYRAGFGRAPVYVRSGGTIPAVGLLRQATSAPIVLMGFALPDDRMHAPNERFHLPTFFRAIDTSIAFLAAMRRRR